MVDRDKLKEKDFVNEFMNSSQAVFTRLNGEVITTNSTKGIVTNDSMIKLNGIGGMYFVKGVFTRITLNTIFDTDFGYEGFGYTVLIEDRFFNQRALNIYNHGTLVGNVVIHYLNTDFKKLGNIRDLVGCISDSCVFRLMDGRVVLGTDVSKYDTRELVRYLYKRSKILDGFENDNLLRHYSVYDTIAFIIGEDGSVDLGLINGKTGDYIAWIEDIGERLSKYEHELLLKTRNDFLTTLDRVELAISKVMKEGHFI